MQAVILLGGLGTRLRALFPDRPKALVPVAGRPFLAWQIDWLRRGGVTDIHLAAGHFADRIEAWAATQDGITVSREPEPLGTGGAVKYIEPHLLSDPFLLVNGDTLLPSLNFHRLENTLQKSSMEWKKPSQKFHSMEKTNEKVPLNGKNERKSSTQWKIALAVTRIEEAGRFGTVEFGTDGGITAFHEKTAGRAGWINGGVYLMERQALASIPEGRCSSLEREWFPLWVAGQHLYAVPTDPPLLDMGTPEGLHTMHQFLSASEMGNRSQCSKELKENDGGGRTVLAKRRGIE